MEDRYGVPFCDRVAIADSEGTTAESEAGSS